MSQISRVMTASLVAGVLLCACGQREAKTVRGGMLEDERHAYTAEDTSVARAGQPTPGPAELPPWGSARDRVPSGMLDDQSQHAEVAVVAAGKPMQAPREPRGR